MEIFVHEVGGEEEQVSCQGCGGSDLEPLGEDGGTGPPTWSLMSRLSARCLSCGRVNHCAWPGRVHFRFAREPEGAQASSAR